MRVLVAEFRQESNSLSPAVSDLDFWRSGWILEPDEVRAALADQACAMAGIIETLDAAPEVDDIIFGPAMYSQSGGTADQSVMEHFLAGLLPVLHSAGQLDAIVLSLHGALQTTEFDDAEAEVVGRIREVVGEQVVISASTDLHGYISRQLIERIDLICGYRTYPHVDFVETGRRAARLALRALTGQRPWMAWVPVPMMVSASAYNSLAGPFRELLDHAEAMLGIEGVLDCTIYQMQPWLDLPDPHSSVVVVAETEQAARRAALDLAQRLYQARHDFEPRLRSIDETIDLAEDPATPKPVILVDSADSNNAGAPGDSMAVAARLLARGPGVRAATVVVDRAAVHAAFAAGVGARFRMSIGGSVDPRAIAADAEWYVRSLHDGDFVPEGVGSAGDRIELGRAAVLRCGSLDVLVCGTIAGNGDPQLYRAFGIEPLLRDLVVVKANTSFRAGYSAIAGVIAETDTPGAAAPQVRTLPFQRIPRTIYPWLDDPEPRLVAEFAHRSA
ncbi:M81 family metallopeptidase [Schumannella luteola]|uniref:Microcystin degradation protein MlrC n=1 Tax=Schumannella luteola TaxID=472059 RepID=A0A852Y965_9MICO|nr:M81 family metallopeptidase [Schumannella luteola]NYG98402.1 microcystin degradation protein MlrC [Schumannella luteola]TPW91147.1 M81 family metallopeptidase [Schumannella luteola]